MKLRTLGHSDIHVSEISLGCMSLPQTVNEARPIVEAALDAGINYFDTADLYAQGVNEEIVGQLLKPYRQHTLLATKVGNRWTADGQWTWDPSPQHIEHGLKESLRRLQTDYIDVYQLHGGTIDDPWEEIIETFEHLKKEGLIRAYGISSIRPNVFVPFLANSHAVSNMMQLNLLDRRPEEWFDSIQASGASVVTRGSLAKGLLTNGWQKRLKGFERYSAQEVERIVSQLATKANIHAVALAFNLQFEAVASTVIGASSPEQLQETLAAYEMIHTIDLANVLSDVPQHMYTEHR